MAVSPQTSKDMNKDLQNKAWQCLPAEFRKGLRETYARTENNPLFEQTAITLCDFFGHENLKSDTEPSELLFVERKKVISLYAEGERKMRGVVYLSILKEFFGDKCLPDTTVAENATVSVEQPSVQGEPKFKVGDIVKVKNTRYNQHFGATGVIKSIEEFVHGIYTYTLENDVTFSESSLEPYTEENKETIEEKELNLAELLKDCERETAYFAAFGEVVITSIKGDRIEVKQHYGNDSPKFIFNNKGQWFLGDSSQSASLYPSSALYEKYPLDAYSAWMEWKEARKPKRWRAGKYEKYFFITEFTKVSIHEDCEGTISDRLYKIGNYFRTEEEAQQAAEGIREYLKSFHEKEY